MSWIWRIVYLGVVAARAFAGIPEAASRTLALFEKAGNDWKIPCASCHHQALSMLALDSARRHGIPVNEASAQAHVTKTLRQHMLSAEGAVGAPVDVFGMGYGMLAARTAGLGPNLVTAVIARRFADWQLDDGHWPVNDARPPMSSSEFTATALAIKVLSNYLPPQLAAERNQRLARARQWLLDAQPRSTEDLTFQLLGLLWSGASSQDRNDAAYGLLASQHKDGGWGQETGMDSDAYATGESLYALRQSGALAADAPAFQRGVRFLLDTQKPDGSWLVRTRLHSPAQISPLFFDSGFPNGRDQFSSFAGSAWAVMGLLEALPEVREPRRPLPVEGAEAKDAKPWMETALFGSLDELRALLDGGADPNMLRFVVPDAGKVKLLLERGAQADDAALMAAATYRDSADSVRLLLDHGAKPTRQALLMATLSGGVATAALLLASGVDPRQQTTDGDSPLVNAVSSDNTGMVRLLIAAGADVNERGRDGITPLIQAALGHRTGMARLLVQLGADPTVVDKFGYTALRHTSDIWYADPKTARVLKKAQSASPDQRRMEGVSK